MKKDSTNTSLLCLALSLGITAGLLAILKSLSSHGLEEFSASVFQKNPAAILAIFFGVYCASMIFYIATRKRRFPDHFRLLLLYCMFPIGIGLAGSILGGEFANDQLPVLEVSEEITSHEEYSALIEKEQSKQWHPFYIGAMITLLDVIALLAVYRSKDLKRANRKPPNA